MKLSLVLTTLLLSSTALANSFEIECSDETNTKLFTINSSRQGGAWVTLADGTSHPSNLTKTETVNVSGCSDGHSLELKLRHAYQPSKFNIEIASHWSEGQEMTRCSGSGFNGVFEGTLSQEGKTLQITCKDLNGLNL